MSDPTAPSSNTSDGQVAADLPSETPRDRAAARVDYRLTFTCTPESRQVHGMGIDGPDLPNSYWHMRGGDKPGNTNGDHGSPTGGGDWSDMDHPYDDQPEADHIDRWFTTAVREAIHEALEWFWVDGKQYLNPHDRQVEQAIHDASEDFALALLAIRARSAAAVAGGAQ